MELMLIAFFVWSVINYVVQGVKIINHEGDIKLRDYFDSQYPDGEAARKLMRDAGYHV